MGTSDVEATTSAEIGGEEAVAKRGKSRISFVYADLKVAVGLVHSLHSNAGSVSEVAQLASWMNLSASGGTFRAILGAAKSFDLIETETAGQVALTKLGRSAVDDSTRPNALVNAFLQVPLHAEMYRQHQGNALPHAAAIERQFESLGVPPKQKARARQTFMKSAQFSGFIDPPTGHFIKPATTSDPPASEPTAETQKRNGGGGGDGEGFDLDPLLIALLRKIPPVVDEWPPEQRVRWFRTLAMNVSQIYDRGDEVVDLVITVESANSEPQQIRATE